MDCPAYIYSRSLGFYVVGTSIVPAARKHKRQNGRAALHILPRGMRDPHGEEARSRQRLRCPVRRLEPCGPWVAPPSRRGADAAPQDEVGGRLACTPPMR